MALPEEGVPEKANMTIFNHGRVQKKYFIYSLFTSYLFKKYFIFIFRIGRSSFLTLAMPFLFFFFLLLFSVIVYLELLTINYATFSAFISTVYNKIHQFSGF